MTSSQHHHIDPAITNDTDILASTVERACLLDGQRVVLGVTLRLTSEASGRMKEALTRCLARTRDPSAEVYWVGFAAAIDASVPVIGRLLRAAQRSPHLSYVFVEGLAHGDGAMRDAASAGMATLLGQPFQYSSQNEGRILALLRPSVDAPPNSNATFGAFSTHTDDALLPRSLRVDWITLYGQLNECNARTGFAPIEDTATRLSSSDRMLLMLPNYSVAVPASFGFGTSRRSAQRPILSVGKAGQLEVACQSFDLIASTPESGHAFENLAAASAGCTRWMSIGPGGWLAFRNSAGMHCRDAIIGAREVVRVYVRDELDALREACGTSGRVFDVRHLL